MATPTLSALRLAYPHARICGLMRPVIHDLLDGAWGSARPWFDETVRFERKKKKRTEFVSRRGLIRILREQRTNLAIVLPNSFWSAAVPALAGVKRIVGYDRDGRGWMLSDRVPVPRIGKQYQPISAVDYYLKLVHWLGAETSNRRMQLRLSQEDIVQGEQLWQQVGFEDRVPTVVINSNAATASLRVWPTDRVRDLSLRLGAELGCQVLLHCGPSEQQVANRIAAECNHPNVASMGQASDLPISLSKAVLAKASVVVSSDSGPRHMAVALDRQVVSLFGPTDPVWTQTYNEPEVVIQEPLACRPCYQDKCALKNHRCMRDISVDRVFSEVARKLETTHARENAA